jgi:hypothetical protein
MTSGRLLTRVIAAMCRQHNESATRRVMRGPAILVLKEDKTHALHANWAELDAGVITPRRATAFAHGRWTEIKCVKWEKTHA